MSLKATFFIQSFSMASYFNLNFAYLICSYLLLNEYLAATTSSADSPLSYNRCCCSTSVHETSSSSLSDSVSNCLSLLPRGRLYPIDSLTDIRESGSLIYDLEAKGSKDDSECDSTMTTLLFHPTTCIMLGRRGWAMGAIASPCLLMFELRSACSKFPSSIFCSSYSYSYSSFSSTDVARG